MKKPIRILVVDDSSLFQDLLSYILSSEDDMIVVGTAKNGKEAIRMAELKKPDIITMDIYMPMMNGLEATRKIMESNPLPIIIVTSSFDPSDINKTFSALDAGALTILGKPVGINHHDFKKNRKELIDIIRAMAEIKVVTKRQKYLQKLKIPIEEKPAVLYNEAQTNYKIVAIGTSTGGPQVLSGMIQQIPANFNMPIVIVQHIAEGFLEGMIEWLSKLTELTIKVAENGETVKKGVVYFCPAKFNISIRSDLRVELSNNTPNNLASPSVSHLFRSINRNFKQNAIGILLTGMGSDGAEELALMKENGALTMVQDKESCIVNGMPGEAVKLNAQKYILSPDNMVKKLIELNEYTLKQGL